MYPYAYLNNQDRRAFMLALFEAAKTVVHLDDWQTQFVASCRADGRSTWFSDRRIVHTDRLWVEFGQLIGHPMPDPPASFVNVTARQIQCPEADPGCCQFKVTHPDDRGRQIPCNAPAAWQRRNGFRYCDAHGVESQRLVKRLGSKLELLAYRG